MNEIKEETLKQALRESAAAEAYDSKEFKKEFAQAITVPILQEVKDTSVARQLFAVENLAPGAQAAYPIADDFDATVCALPKIGAVPQNFIETAGEEVYVPTFRIATAFDWSLTYARDGRIDIAQRCMRNAARTIVEYEEECAWRLLAPSATTAFPGKGLLGPRPAPIVEINGGPAAGFFSKELLNAMITRMKRNRRTLTHLYISPEDRADIREWGESQADETTRRDIFVKGGLGEIYGVELVELHQLGMAGKYNINSAGSGYGIFKLGGGGSFNDYTPTNANVVDANGAVTTAGETQIYGFDLTSNDSLVMPVRQELEFYDDSHNLHRSQKQGFYGWEDIGMAVLDTRMIMMGVVDRSL